MGYCTKNATNEYKYSATFFTVGYLYKSKPDCLTGHIAYVQIFAPNKNQVVFGNFEQVNETARTRKNQFDERKED